MLNIEPIARAGFKLLARVTDQERGLHAYFGMPEHAHRAALGGIRFLPYAAPEDALADAVRLSQAMFEKTSAAELDCGGAKLVVMANAITDRDAVLSAVAEFIHNMNGSYLAGPDMGVSASDLEFMRARARWVACESDTALGSIAGYTAEGVFHGVRACLDVLGTLVVGAHIAIQGAGEVGIRLAELALAAEMKVTIADVSADRVAQAREIGCEVVSPDVITRVACHVFSPCAKGLVVTTEFAQRTPAGAICGSANNQLAEKSALEILAARGVLYAPDYIVNAGGVIRGAEYYLHNLPDSHASVAKIYARTKAILNRVTV